MHAGYVFILVIKCFKLHNDSFKLQRISFRNDFAIL